MLTGYTVFYWVFRTGNSFYLCSIQFHYELADITSEPFSNLLSVDSLLSSSTFTLRAANADLCSVVQV